MRIYRIFYPEVSTQKSTIVLNTETSHYLIRVLRHKLDNQIILFNNLDGFEYLARITDTNPKKTTLNILSFSKKNNESPIRIQVFQALSKGNKLETVIQKATEMGINELTPMFTENIDYKLATEGLANKLKHWQKIAISACEQSGRVFVPKIHYPLKLANALQINADIKLFLSPHSNNQVSHLHQTHLNAQNFAVYIGPEGGFSSTEEKLAISYQCLSVQLGARILRTETAPLAMISILQILWGDY